MEQELLSCMYPNAASAGHSRKRGDRVLLTITLIPSKSMAYGLLFILSCLYCLLASYVKLSHSRNGSVKSNNDIHADVYIYF